MLPASAPASTIAAVMYSSPVAAWIARPRGHSWQQNRAAIVTTSGKTVTATKPAQRNVGESGPNAVAEGRLAFTMSAAEAVRWVDESAAPTGGLPASAALLLDPTPASEIVAVAAEGDVMPQKSTYIYPKALTGLVINPLE